jgi:heavy metal sensor kinase
VAPENWKQKPLVRTVRGLRMRLTVSYVIFFGLLIAGIGFIFRETLDKILIQRTETILDQEWAALRGYLRISEGKVSWVYDQDDPEESSIVDHLRRVLMIADENGNVREISNGYLALEAESRAQIDRVLHGKGPFFKTKVTTRNDLYTVKMGVIREDGKDFFCAIGYPAASNQGVLEEFSHIYFTLTPVLLLLTALLGWWLAGRALRPLNELVAATQRISARNLSLRIPSRGTGDELDTLIHTFNHMLERLERNFEQVRQFSIDASHELRTPLTGIRGQLEVALISAHTVEQHREAMENALQDVERLSHIVKSLILLAQAESGQLLLQKAEVDLTPVIQDLVSQFEIPAEERGIKLATVLPPQCRALVDRVQFERLISNLLSNAVKYCHAGGQIRIELNPSASDLHLSVSDDGPGIAPEYLPYIFDRFYRVPRGQADHDKGLGLGLSFVAWIVKAHGGTIHVESEPGYGTSFRITLPAGIEVPAFDVTRAQGVNTTVDTA